MGPRKNRSGKQEPRGIAKVLIEARQAQEADENSTIRENDDSSSEKLRNLIALSMKKADLKLERLKD
jgi:hypothetical protein